MPLATEESISQEAIILCNEYIHLKLRQLGLARKGRTVLPATRSPSLHVPATSTKLKSGPSVHDTVLELLLVGSEMEQLYPSLFRDVFGQLNILRVTSEDVAEEAFAAVAEEICRAGVTWARVVAVFAVAGALAAECVQQRSYDHAGFVNRLAGGLSKFVRERLAAWIARQGGWSDMTKTFHGTKDEDSSVLMMIGVLGAMCGLAGTILATGKLQESL